MKDKMRCASCGAMFKPMKSSQTKCERCERREREQRAAAKHMGNSGQKAAPVAPQPVRISGPAATLLGGVANTNATQALPPEPTAFGMAAWRDEERRERERVERERREQERLQREQEREKEREARGQSGQSGVHARPHSQHPQAAPAMAGKPRAPKPERAPQAPRPPKVPKPIAPKVELTDDLRTTIEARYLEMARPVEFDGIRTKIATELGVPKSLVKKAVADLRKRMALPSWWELQAYTGPEAELERIRMAYIPLLPVPDVGVHKLLAEQLSMDPRAVYQGIRRIRAEMRLPQYNPPEAHGDQPAEQPSTSTSAPAAMDAPVDAPVDATPGQS